jgi:hypothetical protein
MSEKKSFADIEAAAEAERHNSNLTNLASAITSIKEEQDRIKQAIRDLEARSDYLTSYTNAIRWAGENADKLTYETTKKLYDGWSMHSKGSALSVPAAFDLVNAQ